MYLATRIFRKMDIRHLQWCFLFAVTFLLTIDGQGIPESPCPQHFRYEYYDRWYGRISVPTPEYGSGMRIRLKMQIGTGLPSAYVGRIELIDSKEELESKLYYGGNVNFRIHFPLRFPIPTVDRIRYNGRLICDGPPIQSLYMTNIHLNYDLTPNNNNNFNNFNNINNNFENVNNVQTTTPSYTIEIIEIDPSDPNNPIIHRPIRPQFTSTTKPLSPTFNFTGVQLVEQENNVFVPKTTPQPPTEVVTPAPAPPPVNIEADTAECGRSKKTLTPLIVGGTSYPPGEWPWLVALYHKNSKGVTFACSGSLVSSIHIVTAAHCVLELNKSSKKSFSIVARLGAHNLQDWADPNDRLLNVIKIEVHPDFSRENLQNDIAMLSVDVIQFTDYIRPICIWDGSLSQEELVGKKGKVVGWGRDENGQLVTTEPRLVNMPIVSTETCRSSNPEFLTYTSETTLCAGNRDGLGPCNGDSGGGMYLPMNRRWYIRGIVSNSIKDPEDFGADTCTLRNYVIFTDAAKYVTWIKSVMNG